MEKPKFKSAFLKIFLKFRKTLIFILIFALGYTTCDIYHKVNKKSVTSSEANIIQTLGKISVAINEKDQLLIIDRTNGSYKVFQDSIGHCIFNLYAYKIQSKYEGQ